VFPFFHGLIRYTEKMSDLNVGQPAINPHSAKMFAERFWLGSYASPQPLVHRK